MSDLKIGIVGPCAAGKTTLIAGLKHHGYFGKHIAQEHSYVADMWLRLVKPDILIYLDVSYPLTLERRNMNWSPKEYAEQVRRLDHARQHADLFLNTDNLSIADVLDQVIEFLNTVE
jgi:deoxyadenosine/deoxycytidine kinase